MVASQGKPFDSEAISHITGILDGYKDIIHRASDARDALADKSSVRGIRVTAQFLGGIYLAVMDIVAYAFHKRLVLV